MQGEAVKFRVNLDNKFINNYLIANNDEIDILKEQLKTSMGLIGLVLHSECKKLENDENFEGTQRREKYTSKLAPILMFLIRDISIGNVEENSRYAFMTTLLCLLGRIGTEYF